MSAVNQAHAGAERVRLVRETPRMISVVILYPKSDDSTFDIDYYTNTHMPLFAESVGEACQGWGVNGPGGRYHAIGWMMIDGKDALDAAMAEHGAKILSDVANYTNVQPELVVSDVVAPQA
jgi:uncharacterized protein (TIGR02118 family)